MRMAMIAVLAAISGCTNSVTVQREAEIFSSLPYDEVACGDLLQRRNALAARHGLGRDAEREPQEETDTIGFGIFIPDMRGAGTREKARAAGEIAAMNRSLTRRKCEAA